MLRKIKITLLFLLLTLTSLHGESPQKVALIFGITGQDGAYLTEFLLKKNYIVHGVKRRSSSPNTTRIDRFYEECQHTDASMILHYGDVSDSNNVMSLLQMIQPDEIYNLAAQSHVKVSFELPKYTAEVDALGTLHILDAIRILGLSKKTKYYQASTSELYGLVQETPQTEKTPFYPRSPYGVAKIYGFWITVNYREAYDLYACNGILFNHESPYRGETFLTRKVTLAATKIKCGLQDCLYVGNLEAKRDWGYAKDYVEAMWLMLQQEKPEDFVIATGETHTVREFIELVFNELDIQIIWSGTGVEECGVDAATGNVIVKVDPRYFRPTEVDLLLGNAEKAKQKLGWTPATSFKELVKIMVEADLALVMSGLK